MWDKSKKQAKTRSKKTYVRKRVYTFKREPLTANATQDVASRDFHTLPFAVNVNLKVSNNDSDAQTTTTV